MRRIAVIVGAIFTIGIIAMVIVGGSANAASLPQVVYIDEGPGTFNTPLSNFIVKTLPFDFVFEPGPTYTSYTTERVWGVSGANGAPPAIWDETVDLGPVQGGCIARYVGIDDDLDGRRNTFLLDGIELHTIDEGLVFSGSFLIPEDGELLLRADDSVGGWFSPCDEIVTPTLTASPTSTITSTPEATPTVMLTSTPGPSPTATNTATPGPSPTATNTPLPTNTATPGPSPPTPSTSQPPTVEPAATSTKRPREDSCVRINFDVGGDEAVRGLYIVQEVGGKLLASWYALDGWKDSGWFRDIDITHENVYVKVLYYSGPDATPIEMVIVNPAPDSPYGWMSWGICHAIEVKWPDEKPVSADAPEQGTPLPFEELEPGAVSGPELPYLPPAIDTTTDEEVEQGSVFGASLNS
jgi:hypothetical protein